ncbi:MAG TPA: hypothetical protein VGL81_12080 [Polyangiaceae bacterium]|jgi:hypothetical protein
MTRRAATRILRVFGGSGKMRRGRCSAGIVAVLSAVCAVSAVGCSSDFSTTRTIPPRGTVGTQLFIALCDRVAAQALPEDVTSASWHAVCYPDANGDYAATVDQTRLPPLDPNAVDVDGNPVPLAVQETERAYRVARIEALARDRLETTTAFDAAFPAVSIPLKDLTASDPTQSCMPAGTGPLPAELAAVLGRFVTLEDDGTVPLFTEALGRIMDDVKAAPGVQDALARFDARQGYRPLGIALGAARPMLAYPQLVPMVQSLLSLVATDSDPYDPAGAIDPSKPLGVGNRKPIPGAAATQMQQLLAVGREELRTAVAPAAVPLLATTTDPDIATRQLLSRPRTTLELTRQIMLQSSTSFDVGLTPAAYVVARDPRAYAAVPLVNGAVPAPFVDANGDGLPDVDAVGQFVTTSGQPVPSPFFSPDGVDGNRDAEGRAIGEATPTLYSYANVGQTFMANLEENLRPMLDPDPTHGQEGVMNVLGGSYVLFGDRDDGATSTRSYPPDPSSANPTQPVTLAYSAFHPETSPLVDLVYALGVMMSDPMMDDLLQLARQLMTQHPEAMARLVGLGLKVKAISNAHPEAHIPAASTLWDEMLDVIAQIAHDKDGVGAGGVLEDLFLAFAEDATVPLQQTFAAYIQNRDSLTYNHNSTSSGLTNALNGAAWNLSSNDTEPLHVPVDRTQPDVGTNQSALQRFMQLLHDANGLDVCTKAGAVAHVQFSLGALGTVDFDYPTNSLSGVACTLVGAPAPPNPMPECGILRIQNVDALLLDVVLNRATFDIRDPCLKALMNSPITDIVGGADQFLQTQSGIAGFDTHPTVQGVGRLVYFDTPQGSDPGDTNPNTTTTLSFLSGIIDPVPTTVCSLTPFTDTDGTVLDLRSCSTFGDTIRGRDPGFIFPLEESGFVTDVQPLAAAFDNHGQALLFVDLFDTLDVHWADAKEPSTECDPTLPKSNARWCSQDGAVTYEPLLADVLTNTDLFQTLHDTVPVIQGITVQHCNATDATTGACTSTSPLTGVQVLANAVRVLVDPALNTGLTDLHGVKTAPRNDGTTNPQVTPIYLFIDALDGIDAAFAAWAQAHPSDDRRPAWLAARSQLVDQLFTVDGTGAQSTWANAAVPAIVPALVDAVESQILAQCPDRSSRAKCTWWMQDMPQNLEDVVGGPTFAAVMDLLDAIRSNPTARAQLEQLLQYLLDPAAGSDARAATMTASVDLLQILNDDTNLTPFYNAVAADVLGAQVLDAQGNVAQRGLADAGIEALSRIFAAAHDAQGTETCSMEVDPNGAIATTLGHMVTPQGTTQLTPIETLIDVTADVNRAHPADTTKLDGGDYGNIANEISEFCLDPSTGLEQVYAVVRAATLPDPGN